MRDVTAESSGETEYECLICGHTVVAETHPGNCPECEHSFRNRSTALE